LSGDLPRKPVLSGAQRFALKKTAKSGVFLLFSLYNGVALTYDRVDHGRPKTFVRRFVSAHRPATDAEVLFRVQSNIQGRFRWLLKPNG
jgi:hypothetical protein